MIRAQTIVLMAFLSAVAMSTTAFKIASADQQNPDIKHLSLPGYEMPYIDVGTGEPVVFVHGAIADLRTWSDYIEPISSKHRFISYTRRHYGTQPWTDALPRYSHDQHAQDLMALIESLQAGPVHLVTWSSGGITSTIAAAIRPDKVKSIVHFEPVLDGVMKGVPGADTLGADWEALWGPVDEAVQSGNDEKAAEKMIEVVFELPAGGFNTIPKVNQEIVMDNARTIKLLFNANDTQTDPDCDFLKNIEAPTTVALGAETNEWWTLMSKTINDCMPNSTLKTIAGVNHNGPIIAVTEIVSLIDKQIEQLK